MFFIFPFYKNSPPKKKLPSSAPGKIKRKYGLRYDGAGDLKMGLITTNFYDEISNPKHRAAFEFLDGVYIAKPDSFHSPVRNFSRIAADLRQTYGDG